MAIDRTQAGYLDLDDETMEEHTELVHNIISTCFVVTANHDPLSKSTRFLLIADEFEAISEGEAIPTYTIAVDTDDDGNPTQVTFNKV